MCRSPYKMFAISVGALSTRKPQKHSGLQGFSHQKAPANIDEHAHELCTACVRASSTTDGARRRRGPQYTSRAEGRCKYSAINGNNVTREDSKYLPIAGKPHKFCVSLYVYMYIYIYMYTYNYDI